jgi:ribosomal subunit interface protein
MAINIKTTTIELTEAIRDYTEKRLGSLEKFSGGIPTVSVEIGKTTEHHKQGDFFSAKATLVTPLGKEYFATSEKDDLYVAIDDVREELRMQLTAGKKKEESLFKRGARRMKNMLRGFK